MLIDAQGFIDGIGPMATAPRPLLWLGVKLLQSVPLRQAANKVRATPSPRHSLARISQSIYQKEYRITPTSSNLTEVMKTPAHAHELTRRWRTSTRAATPPKTPCALAACTHTCRAGRTPTSRGCAAADTPSAARLGRWASHRVGRGTDGCQGACAAPEGRNPSNGTTAREAIASSIFTLPCI